MSFNFLFTSELVSAGPEAIYRKTAAYGHLGREQPEFTWERTDKAQALAADC